jgi:hypothetical protein
VATLLYFGGGRDQLSTRTVGRSLNISYLETWRAEPLILALGWFVIKGSKLSSRSEQNVGFTHVFLTKQK